MFLGQNEVKDILERAVCDLNNATSGQLCGGTGESVETALSFMAIERDRILTLLEAYRDRKDEASSGKGGGASDEELVLVGFSDGATLLWEMFNSGRIQGALLARRGPHVGRPYPIAFVGLIDLVRQHLGLLDWIGESFNEPDRRLPLEDGGVIRHGRNYYQQDSGAWKGTALFCQGKDGSPHPLIENVLIPNASHSGSVLPNRTAILKVPTLQADLQRSCLSAYLAALRESGRGRISP